MNRSRALSSGEKKAVELLRDDFSCAAEFSAARCARRNFQNKKQEAARLLASLIGKTCESIFVGVTVAHQFEADMGIRIPAQEFAVLPDDES